MASERTRIASPNSSRPALRKVVPVSTTSAIASATPSPNGRLDCPVKVDQTGVHATLGQVLAQQTGVAGGDSFTGQVPDLVVRSGGCGEAEPASAESGCHDLFGVGTRSNSMSRPVMQVGIPSPT